MAGCEQGGVLDNQMPMVHPGFIRSCRMRSAAFCALAAVSMAGQAACNRGEPTKVTVASSGEQRARLGIAPGEELLFDAAAGARTSGTFVVPKGGYLIRYRCVGQAPHDQGPTVQELWRHGRSSEGASTTLSCDDTEAPSSLEPPPEPGTKVEVLVFDHGSDAWEIAFVTQRRR